LALVFNVDAPRLQSTLKKLKDNLKRCLDKRNSLMKSGAAAQNLPKCKFFDQMLFLQTSTANKPSHTNIPTTTINQQLSIDTNSSSQISSLSCSPHINLTQTSNIAANPPPPPTATPTRPPPNKKND
jgi:hypothetical protein